MSERHTPPVTSALMGMGLADAAMRLVLERDMFERAYRAPSLFEPVDIFRALQPARAPRKRRLKPPTGPTKKRAKVKAARKARHRMKR